VVPELTRSADIKLNERLLLRLHRRSLSVSAPDISPIRTHRGEAVRRYIPLGGFVL